MEEQVAAGLIYKNIAVRAMRGQEHGPPGVTVPGL